MVHAITKGSIIKRKKDVEFSIILTISHCIEVESDMRHLTSTRQCSEESFCPHKEENGGARRINVWKDLVF